MKTRQVLDFCDNGRKYKVIYKYDDAFNPYRIYNLYTGWNQYGYRTERRKEVARYADMNSCFWWFAQNGIGKE